MIISRVEKMKEIALKAGACLRGYFSSDLQIRKKGEIDLVTEADEEAEALIVEAIAHHFPDDAAIAEEGGCLQGESGFRWIIDPLDGTTNFAHGFPHFSVSIALAEGDEIVAGVVNDPCRNELFEAQKGKGALLNGKPIRVGECHQLENALCVSGFPYNRRERTKELLGRVERALMNSQGLRRVGSAALDLAYLAAGRFDVYWEDSLKPWDIAAGQLIVKEAGGLISNYRGEPMDFEMCEILATNHALQKAVIEKIIQPE